jgi:hypothetical protein
MQRLHHFFAASRSHRSVGLAVFGALVLTAVRACDTAPNPPQALQVKISSDPPTAGTPLQEVRFLFAQYQPDGSYLRYPEAPSSPGFTFPVLADNGFDPVHAPVVGTVQYGGLTFAQWAEPVRLQVTGRGDGRVLTAAEVDVDLSSRVVIDIHLRAVPTECDADSDGFLDCGVEGCCDSATPFDDCEPSVAAANPWGTEDACLDCEDQIDQDCRGGDAQCQDADNDGVFDCVEAAAKCGVGDPNVAPNLVEKCDGVDNNCDGLTDEGFGVPVPGQPGKTAKLGDACGVGGCAGGTVECRGAFSAGCSTDWRREPVEICKDGKDNDCDGIKDDGC